MNEGLTIELDLPIGRRRHGRRVFENRNSPARPVPGRVPRIARLMALAIRFEHLTRSGSITDYATLARLGHVTRARVTQIMNLLYLAPDIQEKILFLQRKLAGRDPMPLSMILKIAANLDWQTQRQEWKKMHSTCGF